MKPKNILNALSHLEKYTNKVFTDKIVGHSTINEHMPSVLMATKLLWSPSSLSSEQYIDLLFYPILVVRGIRIGALLVHKAGQISQLVHKVKELTDVIRDGRGVGILPLQMLFVNLAHTFHAFINRLIIRKSSRFWLASRLY